MALRKLKEFCVPERMEEAVALLEKYGSSAMILAGGSFIRGIEARGFLSEVEALIDIRKLGLDGLSSGSDELRVGAMASFAQLKQASEVQTAAWLGTVKDALTYPPLQIKNVATVGGCLAASCPFFDLPVAFMALDGRVTAISAAAKREIGLGGLFTGLFENSLARNEIISELILPRNSSRSASAFIKLEGNANDLAIVNVAASLTIDALGLCREARVVLGGGVGNRVVRSPSAEMLLQGHDLTDERLQLAAEAVGQDINPTTDHRASAGYRLTVAKVLARRTLSRARDRLV